MDSLCKDRTQNILYLYLKWKMSQLLKLKMILNSSKAPFVKKKKLQELLLKKQEKLEKKLLESLLKKQEKQEKKLQELLLKRQEKHKKKLQELLKRQERPKKKL